MTDFKRYLLEEFVEDYEEGLLTRRDALKLLAGVTGSMALATSILAACTAPDRSTATTAPAVTAAPTSTVRRQATPTTALQRRLQLPQPRRRPHRRAVVTPGPAI